MRRMGDDEIQATAESLAHWLDHIGVKSADAPLVMAAAMIKAISALAMESGKDVSDELIAVFEAIERRLLNEPVPD